MIGCRLLNEGIECTENGAGGFRNPGATNEVLDADDEGELGSPCGLSAEYRSQAIPGTDT